MDDREGFSDRILIIDAKAKERLRRFIEEAGPKIQAERDAWRACGRRARIEGVPLIKCPWEIGSWVSVRWIEGWSDTPAPERAVIAGKFNMTPQQHVDAFSEWVMLLDLPDALAAQLIKSQRRAYRADALDPMH